MNLGDKASFTLSKNSFNFICELNIPVVKSKKHSIIESMKLKNLSFLLIIVFICVFQTGCELLTLPLQLLSGMAGLAGEALNLASSLPMPPPWVFF